MVLKTSFPFQLLVSKKKKKIWVLSWQRCIWSIQCFLSDVVLTLAEIHALWSVTHIRCLPASHVAIDFGKNAVTTLRHCCSQGMIKCWNINNEKKELKKFKANNLSRGSNPYLFRPEVLSYHFLNQTCFCTVLAVFIACTPSHNSSFFVNSEELLSWQY